MREYRKRAAGEYMRKRRRTSSSSGDEILAMDSSPESLGAVAEGKIASPGAEAPQLAVAEPQLFKMERTEEVASSQRGEEMLYEVARCGKVTWKWSQLLQVLDKKMDEVLQMYGEKYGRLEEVDGVGHDERCSMLRTALNAFHGPPFTIQRLAEVLLAPHPQYTATRKLVNGLEKLLSVSSTLESIEEDAFA